MTDFLKKYQPRNFKRGKFKKEKIEEDYIDAIEAIEEGRLVFNKNGVPVYDLENHLHLDNKDVDTIKKVNFRSRIKQADKARVLNGIDVEKQQGDYTLNMLSYITQLAVADISFLDTHDYNVLQQVSSVF